MRIGDLRARAVAGGLAALVGCLTACGGQPDMSTSRETRVAGRVLNDAGQPVVAARVRIDGLLTFSDTRGRFRLRMEPGPHVVRVAKRELRATAIVPGSVAGDIVLHEARPGAVSLRFGGDVMAGRRYYDVDDDGDTGDGLIRRHATAGEHLALLDKVRAKLADADLTVVNLETPLLEDPWLDPTQPRPPDFHPTKPYVFGSAPAFAAALHRAGVDVIALGNNHVRDAQDRGLAHTISVLDRLGIPHFGAGANAREAWRPAVLDVRGQRVAFVGCTTITGREHGMPYVAARRHGGAARCTEDRLVNEVRAARSGAHIVVVMVHGGNEYERRQTSLVNRYSSAAVAAGATLVVNGHPHVIGEVHARPQSVIASSMGNLLFDQDVWPTLLGYLLRAEVRPRRVLDVALDPFVVDDYQPSLVEGQAAEAAIRIAAGASNTPFAVVGGSGVLQDTSWLHVRRAVRLGPWPRRLAPGWWVPTRQPGVRVGEDLLWTGSFEDDDLDPATQGALLWQLGPSARLSATAACRGRVGVTLMRNFANQDDAVLTPSHRQVVTAGQDLTVLASLSGLAPSPGSRVPKAKGSLELHWYSDTEGASYRVTALPVDLRRLRHCRRVRIDARVPEGAVAVQPYVRLHPPGGPATARLGVDDLELVRWGRQGSGGRQWNMVEPLHGRATWLQVVADVPPRAHPPVGPWAR